MSQHKEINFETDICQHMAAHGWFYADGDAAGHDRAINLLAERRTALISAAVTGQIDVRGAF
jgi:type I restriction enzyme R subunit